MAVEIESTLISTAVNNKDLKSVVNAKVTEKFFYGNENKLAFRWLLDYFREYGGMPTKDTFIAENPGFDWNCPGEPIKFWIKKIQTRQRKNIFVKYMEEAWQKLQDSELDDAIRSVQTGISAINKEVNNTEDLDWTEGAVNRAKDVKAQGKRKGLLGIPTPWAPLSEMLQGWQDGQLVTVYGRPGTGKTFEICLYALHAWELGYKPLIISKEMDSLAISRRLDSMKMKIAHEKMRSGKISGQENAHMFAEAKELEEGGGSLIISSEETLEGSGVSNVAAKIQEYKPDLFIIDGVYLLQDEEESKSKVEGLVKITQGLKRLAKVHHIPGIVTAQANRATIGKTKDTNLSGTQWSDSFASDSDVLIRLFQTEAMKASKRMGHSLEKQRDGVTTLFYTNWDFSKMNFSLLELSDGELVNLEREQEKEAQEA